MSTNANVGIVNEDKTIDTIYVHFDGYLDCVGKQLLEHWTDPEQIKKLMQLGDLSILGEQIGGKQNFNKWDEKSCLAYHRDRGEDWESVAPEHYDDIDSYMLENDWQQYNYLFVDGEWTWCANNNKDFKRLTEEKTK